MTGAASLSGIRIRRLRISAQSTLVLLVGALLASSTMLAAQAPLVSDAPASVPGPLERRAVAITPENPIPSRTKTVLPEYPRQPRRPARGTVTLRVTLDAEGRIAETRRPFNPDLSVVQVSGTRYLTGAPLGKDFLDAAVSAVRKWRYDRPRQAPISFFVRLLFSPSAPTIVVWHNAEPPPMPSGDDVPALSGTGANGVPPAPQPGFSTSIDASVTPPRKIKDVRPVYPAAAQRAKVEGTVVVEITVGVNGRVADARVVRSIPALDQAALDSVRGWQFAPALRNGVATPFVLPVTVSFTLGN